MVTVDRPADDAAASASPQVSFYHLQSTTVRGIHVFCCRLADKAHQLGHTVAILTGDEQHSRLLDDLLWNWRDDSFLPHGVAGEAAGANAPVRISHDLSALPACDLLINLRSTIAADLDRYRDDFQRIAEIIDQDPNTRQQGRIRYSYYHKHNYPLEYHEIKPDQ